MSDEQGAQRLRLDPLMNVVRDGAEACQLVISERQLFRLQGKTVPLLVDQVLPLLDGTRTVAQLRQALASQLNEKSLDELLRLLVRNRVLHDVTQVQPLSAEEQAAYCGVFRLLSRFSESPEQMLGQLRKARVAVVGTSALLQDVVDALGDCAVGDIDVFGAFGAPAAALQAPKGSRLHTPAWEELESTVARADLALGLQDGDFSAVRELKALNQACLRHGQSWLHLRLTLDAEGWLGPLHGPGGACFECLGLRIKSNLKAGRESAIAQQQTEQGLVAARTLEFAPFRRQLASMAAIEVLKHLTQLELTQLFSRCCLVDFLTQETSLHTVLKHPACPACGVSRDGRLYPWDKDEVLLERTLLPQREEKLP
jgi:bacteriocin biosynthesis cyclodehydratase domain-containing protein